MTWRRSNNQWSGSRAAQPAPKNSECKNPLEMLSSRFFGIKMASSTLIIFQRAKLSKQNITHLCWCNRSCSCMTMPRLTGYLQPRRNWLTWDSNVLITHPLLQTRPHQTTTCSLTEKRIERLPFFVSRVGHCCRRGLVGRTTF